MIHLLLPLLSGTVKGVLQTEHEASEAESQGSDVDPKCPELPSDNPR